MQAEAVVYCAYPADITYYYQKQYENVNEEHVWHLVFKTTTNLMLEKVYI